MKFRFVRPPPPKREKKQYISYPSRPEQRQHFLHRRRRAFALPRGVHFKSPELGRRHQFQGALERQPHCRLFRVDPRSQPLDLVEVEDERAEHRVCFRQGLGELAGPGTRDVCVAKDGNGEPRAAANGVGRGELVEARVEGLEPRDEDERARAVRERADVARRRRGGRRRRRRRGRSRGRGVLVVLPPGSSGAPASRLSVFERALERCLLGLDARPRGLERRRPGLESGPGEVRSIRSRGGSCFLGLGREQRPRRRRVRAAEREKVGLGKPQGGSREPLGFPSFLSFFSFFSFFSFTFFFVVDDYLVGEASEGGGVGGVELGLEVGGLTGREREREREKERRESEVSSRSRKLILGKSNFSPFFSSPALSAWRAARRCRH